ncbi:type II secretion system F family protein [Chitinibacter bivalviorum]|uniref:Type II secretion system F family protein n=1 Tax=Chitinibacter bivalviorum TaxID=2739434 RepID=A0A7H9BJQ1_9NEIS|nr:type II secretion system F family protein [Chitinibacter bivalviorum]QLG88803.1 type II secretion system F family protein [Chitinibacter bivalviorum]
MQYRYRAADAQGRVQQGQMEAANMADLELRLGRLGMTLIHAKGSGMDLLGRRKIERRDLITFCFHMEQLTRAGVPLLEGLVDLRDSLDHPKFREVIANVIEDIEGGSQLSQAMAAHPEVFDSVFVNLIRAGEASGELPSVLKSLTESIKWQDELIAQTKRVVMYPAFVGALVFCVVCFLMIYLVPQLVEFIKSMKQEVPLNTQILLWVSAFFVNFWWLIISAPPLIFLFIRWRNKVDPAFRFKFDGWKLRIPAVGPILHKIILARFANFFALLYGAGIPILECIRITEGIVGNLVIADALNRAEMQIREGQGVTASFERVGLFPPLVLRMLRVGESTGQLDNALMNVSYFYNRDIKEAIERVQSLIEPMMTVILGLILAWIMSSVLGPIFDTISKLR